jgi:hypothetical protein
MARKRKVEPGKRKVYVVERLSWHFWCDDGNQPCCNSGEEQGGVPVEVFANQSRARALCKDLERQARAEVCPFQFHHAEPEMLSSKSEKEFHKAIRRIGLPLPTAPEGGYVNWYHWWQGVEPTLTPDQREAVWDLLDQVQFYRVGSCELEE